MCGVAGEQDPAFTEPVCDSVVQRWASWSDDHGDVETVFTRDDLLSDATIWWAGDGIATSIRTYANNHCYPWTPSHDRWPVVAAPTGSTFVGYENPLAVTTAEQRVRSFLASDRADWYRHVNVTAHDHGGHFIRGSFRPSGSTTCAGPSADSADRRRLRLVRLLSVVMVETESADSWPSTSCPTKRGDAIRDRAHGDAIAHAVTDVFGTTDANESVEPAVKSGDWTQQWVQGSPCASIQQRLNPCCKPLTCGFVLWS